MVRPHINGYLLWLCPYSPLTTFCVSDKSSNLTTAGQVPSEEGKLPVVCYGDSQERKKQQQQKHKPVKI